MDAALRELELLLSIPSPISVSRLRRQARWDTLRHDPRFGLLLKGKGLDGTPMRS